MVSFGIRCSITYSSIFYKYYLIEMYLFSKYQDQNILNILWFLNHTVFCVFFKQNILDFQHKQQFNK